MTVNGAAAETMSVVVSDTSRVADDIFLFELRHGHGADLPEFTAGSHIALRVPNGVERKYSLCNDPAERDRYVMAVKREPDGRGGSLSLVDGTTAGDELLISNPRNDFGLVKSPAGYLFIAPAMLVFFLFTLLPVAIALYLSFTNYDVFTRMDWIGV